MSRFERSSDGHASIHLSGSDFWMVLPLEPFEANEVTENLALRERGSRRNQLHLLGWAR